MTSCFYAEFFWVYRCQLYLILIFISDDAFWMSSKQTTRFSGDLKIQVFGDCDFQSFVSKKKRVFFNQRIRVKFSSQSIINNGLNPISLSECFLLLRNLYSTSEIFNPFKLSFSIVNIPEMFTLFMMILCMKWFLEWKYSKFFRSIGFCCKSFPEQFLRFCDKRWQMFRLITRRWMKVNFLFPSKN